MEAFVSNAPPVERIAPLLPQLEIDGLVAVSELGAVFRARQKSLDREVALKIVTERVSGDEHLVEAFVAEARLMAPLQHPNLVRVFDFGRADGLLWVIQEWVSGRTVREMLAEGPMGVDRAGELMIQVCRGLGHAHDHGAIHGDLRASNLMIDDSGRVKVMNFGLGRILMARAGADLPGVVAPELLDPDLEVDHRADIFALGVLFYEMLVGERPVGDVELPSVARPEAVGRELDDIVAACLQPDPARRFQDCAQLRRAIADQLQLPAPSTPIGPITPRPLALRSAGPVPPRPVALSPGSDGSRGKWLWVAGLVVAIGVAAWAFKTRQGQVAAIEQEHDRKIREVEAKILENERLMAEAGRAATERPADAGRADRRAEAEDPPPAAPESGAGTAPATAAAAADRSAPTPAEPGGEDERAAGDPLAGTTPQPDPHEVPAAGEPPQVPQPAPGLAARVPDIPELRRLREQLAINARDTMRTVSERLAAVNRSYAAACSRMVESAVGTEADFWEAESAALAGLGRPPVELPLVAPGEAGDLRRGWTRDFEREAAALSRFRDIYRREVDRIRTAYFRDGNEPAVRSLELERAACLEPDYFLALCAGQQERCGLLVAGNVAHALTGAVGTGTVEPARINDGESNLCSGRIGQPIGVELGGLLRLARIRFELNEHSKTQYFRYLLRVSPDGENWEIVCDRSERGEWRNWQEITFTPRPVRYIELVGTHNSEVEGWFSIREMEAYCTPPD